MSITTPTKAGNNKRKGVTLNVVKLCFKVLSFGEDLGEA